MYTIIRKFLTDSILPKVQKNAAYPLSYHQNNNKAPPAFHIQNRTTMPFTAAAL
jgi:prophage antirepressor-like protein